jgi:hypothetical protein
LNGEAKTASTKHSSATIPLTLGDSFGQSMRIRLSIHIGADGAAGSNPDNLKIQRNICWLDFAANILSGPSNDIRGGRRTIDVSQAKHLRDVSQAKHLRDVSQKNILDLTRSAYLTAPPVMPAMKRSRKKL